MTGYIEPMVGRYVHVDIDGEIHRIYFEESGAGIPDYLDPADDASWYQAILDYAVNSPRRQAQLARIAGWRPPSWQEHFATVDRLIGELP